MPIANADENRIWEEIGKVKDIATEAYGKANIIDIKVDEYHKEKNNCLVFCKEQRAKVDKLNIWQAEQNKETEKMAEEMLDIKKNSMDIANNTKDLPLKLIKVNVAMFSAVMVFTLGIVGILIRFM